MFAGRYLVFAISCFYLAVFVAVDHAAPPRRSSIGVAVIVVWLLVSQSEMFVLKPFQDLHWGEYAGWLERVRGDPTRPLVMIPVNPDRTGIWFHIAFGDRAIAPDVSVPAEGVVGRLADDIAFEQPFVARCANLSEVDLAFDRQDRSAMRAVRFELIEEPTGRVVRGAVIDPSRLEPYEAEVVARAAVKRTMAEQRGEPLSPDAALGLAVLEPMQSIYFAPIADSEGRRFVIRVTAVGGTAEDGVGLLGSASQSYPDARARRNGDPLPGNLTFRYGCDRG